MTRPASPKPKVAAHTRIGRRGEAAVAGWLRGRGATVLARNLRLPAGEADVVGQYAGGRGVLVEVKATAGDYALLPRVDARKRARLFAIAEQLVARFGLVEIEVLVAAVALLPDRERIEVYELEGW